MAENEHGGLPGCCEGSQECRYKDVPRDEEVLRALRNRLSRAIGQLGGISRMLDENRYCGDILTQLAAAQSALDGFGWLLMQDHLETCVADRIRAGDDSAIDEVVGLLRRMK